MAQVPVRDEGEAHGLWLRTTLFVVVVRLATPVGVVLAYLLVKRSR